MQFTDTVAPLKFFTPMVREKSFNGLDFARLHNIDLVGLGVEVRISILFLKHLDSDIFVKDEEQRDYVLASIDRLKHVVCDTSGRSYQADNS